MSEQSSDPRNRLVREKYFSLRPKPLERWLWQRGVPQAAERVFWLHWEEGMRARDWCSELPLRRVAALCCVDASTVTRAYQLLKTLGLIRRQDPGRDPGNPFQQATAVTEVRIPRELLQELSRSPNRCRMSPAERVAEPQGGAVNITAERPKAANALPGAPGAPESPPTSPDPSRERPSAAGRPTREAIQALWGRASASERGRYFAASRDGSTQIEFDADTRLTLEDRAELLRQLEQMARARSKAPEAPTSVQPDPALQHYAKSRRFSPLELARTRKRVLETVPAAQAPEVHRQIVWAVEEGALRRFELPLAVNIALKKLREGAWSRPNRMPPNWVRMAALPETCSAA